MTEHTTISGDYTTAKVFLPEEEIEDSCYEQIEKIVDHEAFTKNVRIMPDAHWGAGCVIGFSMPITEKIIPNVIGVDIGCFTGDTEVQLLDGKSYKIKDLAEKEDSFYVYSCRESGEVTAAEATAMKTRKNSDLVEVKLDNDSIIRCTPDHKFMLRNGEYKQAKNLEESDSLMPLYKSQSEEGYEKVYNNKTREYILEHWMVARSGAMDIPEDVDDAVIHHENFNKKDNRPENLRVMERKKHSELHRSLSKDEHWQSEEFEKKRIESLRNREATQQEIEAAKENLMEYMEENREEWLDKISDSGERGKKYLQEFNKSQRECSVCGKTCENPAAEYWHQIREHREETEYEVRDDVKKSEKNHKVVSVNKLSETEDVYCLHVPEYHNFALSSGVFVHNCGVLGANVGDVEIESHEALDEEIRERVPMGREVRDFDNSINVKEDFNWESVNKKFESFRYKLGEDIEEFESYDINYFKEVCEKVGYDTTRAIKSIGSLGGGNHFIEIGEDRSRNKWVLIHSGSRGLGAKIAEYWQDKAVENRKDEVRKSREDTFKEFVPDKYEKYVNNDLSFNKELIRSEFEGEKIQKVFGELGNQKGQYQEDVELDYDEDLAYLEGEERHGYFIDMIFAQEYASRSRREMLHEITEILNVNVLETVESVHNYIDFKDLTMRKGACPAREGQRIIIPYNMRDGAVIARGKGNSDWNSTAPHGAGRNMGRREAHRNLDEEEFYQEMSDIKGKFTSEMLDEAPMAYKETKLIQKQIKDTAEIEKELNVIHNIKAE